MKQFFKSFFNLIDKNARKKIPILLFFFLISSTLDVFGIGLIAVFLTIVVNFKNGLLFVPEDMRVFFLKYDHHEVVAVFAVLMIFIFLMKCFFGILVQRKLASFSTNFALTLKKKMLKLYQSVNYLFHTQQNTANFLTNMSQADIFSNQLLMPLFLMISNFLVAFGILLVLCVLHPKITAALILVFLFLFLMHDFFLKKKLLRTGRIIAQSNRNMNKSIIQALLAFKEIRVLGKEDFFLNELALAAEGCADAYAIQASFTQIPRYTIESFASVFLVIFVLIASSAGNITSFIPVIGIFLAAFIRLLPTINQIVIGANQIRGSHYSLTYLNATFSELTKSQTVKRSDAEPLKNFHNFELKDVTFSYQEGLKPILQKVNLTIQNGKSIGIIGPSGAGKSTLLNLILGVLEPTKGEFLVDGENVTVSDPWFKNFSYIPQDIFLLDESLRKNIAFGVSDECIDSSRLKEVLEKAQLLEVVENLPDGIETKVGENGICLSGGQKQRVALARALYHEKNIIVMDEATSALDEETEQEVINAIFNLKGVNTLVIVAHRMSTIRYCDVVVRLEQGKIVEIGAYDQVVKNYEQSLA